METEPTTVLAVVESGSPPLTLFGESAPAAIVARASEVATALAAVVKARQLAVRISGREHVRVEGWTLLGTMLGVFPVCTWTRQVEDGFEARVEARTLAGQVVGAAESQCTRSEAKWRDRDAFALRSMAQTRATAKALCLPLGFVMSLAGYDATPAEEMPADEATPVPSVAAREDDPQTRAARARLEAAGEWGFSDRDAFLAWIREERQARGWGDVGSLSVEQLDTLRGAATRDVAPTPADVAPPAE